MYEKSLDGDDLTHQFLMMTIPPVICMKEDLEEDVAAVQGEPSFIPMVRFINDHLFYCLIFHHKHYKSDLSIFSTTTGSYNKLYKHVMLSV